MIQFAPISESFAGQSTMASPSGTVMEKYSRARRKFSLRRSTETAERIINFLRRKHPIKTADYVAAETGIGVRTIAKWLEGATVPGGLAFLQLVAAYGPDFLCAAMTNPPRWLDAAARAEERAKLEAALDELQQRLERVR